MEITDSTIAGNSADAGGGYVKMTGPSVKGTIFDDNIPRTAPLSAPTIEATTLTPAIAAWLTRRWQPQGHQSSAGKPLANNGGPTETFALETSPSMSPAIDRIPVADCTDQNSPTPQALGTDQRLFTRPDPGNPNACDSGAYEVGALQPFVLNSERVQIARSSTANSDHVNIGLTFTENGDPDCDAGRGRR